MKKLDILLTQLKTIESSVELERINTNYNDIAFPPPYFEELYQDITDEMLNK